MQQPILIDEIAAAEALGVSVHFLRKDRRTKRIIPFVKLGDAVRYSPQALVVAMASLSRGGVK